MSYVPKTYHKQGGDKFVIASGGSTEVESGGSIKMLTGSKQLPNSGTQAVSIADITTTSGTVDAADRAIINSIIAAIRGVNIIA